MSDPRQESADGDTHHEAGNPVAAMVEQASRALREVEPAAFLVQPRVLRRVIKQEWELPALTAQVPHRKSRIVSRNTVIRHIDWDELGLEPNVDLPDRAILIARPDEKRLESMSLSELKRQVWRLLFHAKIHDAFDRLLSDGTLTTADFRRRIDQLGQVEFDEIQTVLKRENFIPADAPAAEVFVEFVAVYCELKCFAPHCLGSYFPSFSEYRSVDRLLNEDVNVEQLFHSTRLDGSPDPDVQTTDVDLDETDEELEALTGHAGSTVNVTRDPAADPDEGKFPVLLDAVTHKVETARKPGLRIFARLIRRADKAFARGNAVGASLYQMQAAKYATPELVSEAISGALTDLQRLVRRLQAALNFDQTAARSWYEALVGLLLQASQGFWNADKRLLYDLQKVCVDHEKETYTVDLIGCAASFGRRPIKRELPNQREVLMSKHLRSATRRLVASRLTGQERRRLSRLLHDAAQSSEHQMRTRLRPLAESALDEVGLTPQNLPERIALSKLTEELLDVVANRGFLTMGNLRDAISRSNLKISDLSGPTEFLIGDKLLKADRQLNRVLDGVYQRGDIYLCWLQRLSAVSFGTAVGRFSTRFIFIPYGTAYITFEAAVHVVEVLLPKPKTEEFVAAAGQAVSTVQAATSPMIAAVKQDMPSIVFALGTLLLLIIHAAPFRLFLKKVCAVVFSGMRRAFYEWPLRFLRLNIVRTFLKSSTVYLIRKFLLWPLIPTTLVCWALPRLYLQIPVQPWMNWGIVLMAMSVIFNSRVGRDVEELSAEWLHSTWNQIRVHILVALFDLVMDFFKRLLEWFERVLYAVDEWLRFKSGETTLSLGIKAVLGVFWAAFTFVVRFCVNLLIEPQINPIKHFPVVTVSHKLLLPLTPSLISQLGPLVGSVDLATAIVTPTIFLAPGIFGFMAWELKSNWQLYKANRGQNLTPVLVGDHGETFMRLMKPGFHSGTLPKLFLRLRRIDRRRTPAEHSIARSRYLDQLHHVHVAVKHFVDRELLQLLRETSDWHLSDLSVSRIRLASNNIRIELACPSLSDVTLLMVFEEQSGWLVANAFETGWVNRLETEQRDALMAALVGFYKLAGVDMVREQIAASFAPRRIPYDVTEEGLVVWPDGEYAEEAVYNLWHHQIIRPYPRSVARSYLLPTLTTESLIFAATPLAWNVWAARWSGDAELKSPVLPENVRWSWARDDDKSDSDN